MSDIEPIKVWGKGGPNPPKVAAVLEELALPYENRVTRVLEGHLARQAAAQAGEKRDGPWLVGRRYSYADLAFLSWQTIVTRVIQPEDGYTVEDYPHVKDWLGRISARAAVKKTMGDVEPLR